jgi:ATP-dependent helicase HrpA
MRHEAAEISAQSFPDQLQVGATALPLEYRFEPGEAADGVTLVVPLPLINQVSPDRLDWLVPGLIEERITALLRGLPKALRKSFVPIPDTAKRLAARLAPSDRPLIQALAEEIRAVSGVHIPEDAWDQSVIPPHLRMKVRLVDEAGRSLAVGDDPLALKRQFAAQGAQGFTQIPSTDLALEREGVTRWTFGDLPESVDLTRAGIRLRGYPALVDQGESVAIRVLDSAENAAVAHRAGLRRLIMLHLGPDIRQLRKQLPELDRMRLQYAKAPLPSFAPAGGDAKPSDLADELIALILDLTFVEDRPPIRAQAVFAQRLAECKPQLLPTANAVCWLVGTILSDYQSLRKRLATINQVNWMPSILDIRDQLDALVFRGFPPRIPYVQLKEYPRYLKGIGQRIERLAHAPDRDRRWMSEMAAIQTRWRERETAARAAGRQDQRLDEIRWLLEELRVSLFAQQLGTACPVSVKRIEARWKELGL